MADAEAPEYDWSAFYDDEGTLYYYNSVTEESAWEAPSEGFNPPDANNDDGNDAGAEHIGENGGNNDSDNDAGNENNVADENAQAFDWSAYYDDEGSVYYYNSVTEESAWEAPAEGFNPPEPMEGKNEKETKEKDEEEKRISPVEGDDKVATGPDGDDAVDMNVNLSDAALDKSKGKDDAAATETSNAETNENRVETSAVVTQSDSQPSQGTLLNGTEAAMEKDTTEQQPTEPSAENEVAEMKMYDWSAHYDAEAGRLYYFNSVTDESSWEAPEGGFNPPETEDGAGDQKTTGAGASVSESNADAIEWTAYRDEEGNEYYVNSKTEESSWEKPDKFIPYDEVEANVDEQDDAADETESVTKSPSMPPATDTDDEISIEERPPTPVERSPSPPPVDPAVKRLEDAEAALARPDSVLEPSCMTHVTHVVEAKDAPTAISALIENYHGQTAVCGLVSKWLADLQKQKLLQKLKSKKSGTAVAMTARDLPSLSSNNVENIREVAQNVINKMVKERYTKEAGDSILNLSKAEAAFLEQMMDSPRWRKLLIDLSAKHKDSAVLLFCLRAISKRGHHREIAKRVNQSEHFAVFNAMLSSELIVIGGQAIAAGTDVASATGFEDLVLDLQRACCATSFTYLYSIAMLRRLVVLAEENRDGTMDARFRRVVRKWKALSERLENMMLDPAQSATGSSPLFKKRRMEIALSIGELHQRQRRQRRRLGSADAHVENGTKKLDDLEIALLTLLRRHSIGIQLDDSVLDQLLPSGLDLDTRDVGSLLILHPLAIRALLGHLYKPGQSRITGVSTKNKAARLVSLATLAAEASAKQKAFSDGNVNALDTERDEDTPDELAITRMIVQGCQLCELVETMVSFLVTADPDKVSTAPPSAGLKLCSLALKCTPVGLGVVLWAREFTHGPDFAASASFPTLSLSILSLVRLVAMKHPFARADAVHVALAFLRHSNSDISYQKVNSIKECTLRLLLFLMMKGEVSLVLANMLSRLEQAGSSELDASLVRYFVAGVLEIVQPPVSPVFLRMFGKMLLTPKATEAVRSNYFAEHNRLRLASLLISFKDEKAYNGSALEKQDLTIVATLQKTYQMGK